VVVETLGADRAFWKQVWGFCVLSPAEREVFQNLSTSEPEQVTWLAGRTAAKEAVRVLLARNYGVDVPSADIELVPSGAGLLATGAWQTFVDRTALVSIAQRDGFAAALAWLPPAGASVGLGFLTDLVQLRPNGFVERAMTAGERVLLGATLPMDAHLEWAHRIRCAKQAAVNAMGIDVPDAATEVVARGLDASTGTITLALAGRLGELFPSQAADGLVALTRREGDIVVATILCSMGHPIHATSV
jgi:phosphopantetheinyl transferase (holo-ACP synthase)